MRGASRAFFFIKDLNEREELFWRLSVSSPVVLTLAEQSRKVEYYQYIWIA
jgi:hypothetical protein